MDEFDVIERKDTISIKKQDLWKYSTFVLLIVVVIGAYYIFTGKSGGGTTGNVIINEQEPDVVPGETGRAQVSADDDAVKGDKNAKVTIIEFSDYECPFCQRFYSQTLSQIDEQYIKTGKVKLVYRDFPLTSIHQNAQKAAEAAECAGEQGKYWEMHNTLFEKGVSGGVNTFKTYSKDIGLDQGKFNTCLDSGKMTEEVRKDLRDGESYGVSGTPAFFVNGKIISGAQPFSVFQQAIEAEL